jgi:hypothetical protein
MKASKAKNAYMKKKDPLFVRESLLNAAFEVAATKGMADVTVNKVSELADVTKGASRADACDQYSPDQAAQPSSRGQRVGHCRLGQVPPDSRLR